MKFCSIYLNHRMRLYLLELHLQNRCGYYISLSITYIIELFKKKHIFFSDSHTKITKTEVESAPNPKNVLEVKKQPR